jgi:uncharacterized HhH-GPD family protein
VDDRLWFTDSDEANELLVRDPFALLVGFALDQQVPVQKAFMGPLVLRERLGTLDPGAVAAADLEPLFRERPAIHRFPGAMAGRVQALAAHVAQRYDGDAARVWTDATSPDDLRAHIAALPGFGEMKVKALSAVLAKRLGVELARPLAPSFPTLGDVDSREALAEYQAGKRAHKAAMRAARSGSP